MGIANSCAIAQLVLQNTFNCQAGAPKLLLYSCSLGEPGDFVGLVFGVIHSQRSVSRKRGCGGKNCCRETFGVFFCKEGSILVHVCFWYLARWARPGFCVGPDMPVVWGICLGLSLSSEKPWEGIQTKSFIAKCWEILIIGLIANLMCDGFTSEDSAGVWAEMEMNLCWCEVDIQDDSHVFFVSIKKCGRINGHTKNHHLPKEDVPLLKSCGGCIWTENCWVWEELDTCLMFGGSHPFLRVPSGSLRSQCDVEWTEWKFDCGLPHKPA